MKGFLISAGLAAALIMGAPAASEAAKVRVGIFFGVPHYRSRGGPGYVYRSGYGWYLPSYRVGNVHRMSCGQAMRIVRNRGYHNVSTVECRGATYTFRAMRNGHRHTVFVNARTGGVWRG